MYLFSARNEDFEVVNSSFCDNTANVFTGYGAKEITFTDCTFNNNTGSRWNGYYSFDLAVKNAKVTFVRCDLGDSTFNDRSRATFEASGVGSMLGEGSLTMVISLLALIASGVAVVISVVQYKKKAVPATAGKTAEGDDEE